MSLIDDQCSIAFQGRLGEKLSEEHSIRHVLEDGFIACTILKADGVTNFISNLCAHLIRYTSSNAHRSDSPRLRAPDLLAILGIPGFMQILRKLCCLPRTSFRDDNEHLILGDCLQ